MCYGCRLMRLTVLIWRVLQAGSESLPAYQTCLVIIRGLQALVARSAVTCYRRLQIVEEGNGH